MSFALPVKDESSEESQEKSSETGSTASQIKTSSSSPFTAVKQVQKEIKMFRLELNEQSNQGNGTKMKLSVIFTI